MERLLAIIDELLAPNGCPWDREQTHESLRSCLIEECYEVIEAIELNDMTKLREELGDLLLQVAFHAALAKKANEFDFATVAAGISEKMIKRHPHVFAKEELNTSEEVLDNWEKIKAKEGRQSIMEGIPQQLPALMRAYKIQNKAAKLGFDWDKSEGALEKIVEEAKELALAENPEEIFEEMGDLFFSLVNLARLKKIDAEQALQKSSDKFIKRFAYIEKVALEQGRDLEAMGLDEMDELWDKAKAEGL